MDAGDDGPRWSATKTAEAFAHLDVCGLQLHGDRASRWTRELLPEPGDRRAPRRHPPAIDKGWAGVTDNPNVIGDFTWTGWDYLGEAGIGRVDYGDGAARARMTGFHGEYPWLAAWCGDIDITGHRRPQSYYREIVFGLRTDPYLAVRRPEHHGEAIVALEPVGVERRRVELELGRPRGRARGRRGLRRRRRGRAAAERRSLGPAARRRRAPVPGRSSRRPTSRASSRPWPGAADKEIGRTTLRSADRSGRGSTSQADRTEIAADPTDLAFVEITLVDGAAIVHRPPTGGSSVEVDGPGRAARAWPAPTRPPRSRSPRPPARPSTAARSRSSARPGRGRSP